MEFMGLLDRWPLLLCIVEVAVLAVGAVLLIVRYDGNSKPTTNPSVGQDIKNMIAEKPNCEELWMACGGKLHPGWLLAFRALAFVYLLPLLLYNFITDGPSVFYFYTQWTFALLIAYFGIAVYISSKACLHLRERKEKNTSARKRSNAPYLGSEAVEDHEAGYLIRDESDRASIQILSSADFQRKNASKVLESTMQTIFQVSAPAVLITDSVYWLLLAPLFSPATLDQNFLNVNMHGVNAILLMGEISLNSMPFPWFRGAYFALWSILYVVFQWSVHLLGLQWWPYPFLDISTPWAPLWYLGLIAVHFACFGVCLGLVKAKENLSCWRSLPRDNLVEEEPTKIYSH
ncbi:hypothetical protein O6H91_11G021000 [Diphasiastrum complanatum]|uniref:Uncharacterized protein n=1 Tax=Diphasiastrum complanatum TaxID=34168 RepID=A0ACC2C6V7_DIPCM|nr:hypothetical protein O6H91_11G021000 [Diphasiastrum complanatum]